VLAIDETGRTLYCNPQAGKLLGLGDMQLGVSLSKTAPQLFEHIEHWKHHTGTSPVLLANNLVSARFLSLDTSGDTQGKTLVLLEDPTRAEALAQQIKLAALGRLTLNIAHEIRNPLSAISHAAQLLGEEAPSAPMIKLTKIIQNNVYRLDRMVQDILSLSRRERSNHIPLELDIFVERWLEEWRQAEEIPENAVIMDMSNPATVDFSPQHLHQILWNLASNAWRYCDKQAGSIRLSIQSDDQTATLSFCDNGTGIDPRAQSQLFEPFHTTHPQGTGLGLYIARELAEANHARLEFIGNQPGACFNLTIPVMT
jgi:two-component system sensor histidine kinase PilS (NtrC family)